MKPVKLRINPERAEPTTVEKRMVAKAMRAAQKRLPPGSEVLLIALTDDQAAGKAKVRWDSTLSLRDVRTILTAFLEIHQEP